MENKGSSSVTMPARSRIDIHWPAVEGHTLVIPRRHVASLFDLGRPEVSTCMTLLQKTRDRLIAGDNTITGFNVGMNDGEDAGQTIFHCHWHLIPRRKGDVNQPSGGVRNTIPGKGIYK